MRVKRILWIGILLTSLAAHAGELPQAAAIPGGVLHIDLKSKAKHPPHASWQGKRLLIYRRENGWWALLGIPYAINPGDHHLRLETPIKNAIPFRVHTHKYPFKQIKLKNNKLIQLNAVQGQRLTAERALLKRTLQRYTAKQPQFENLLMPVQGRISQKFGVRRQFNHVPQMPHDGIDIAAAEGTPVVASASGMVALTGDWLRRGKVVVIDHGMGLFTLYQHLSSVNVRPGRLVSRGNQLGKVGQTGLTTGPHLHWSVFLNQTAVDPLRFIALKN
jgi:murein DD-endopeptidase MepM/ murein hydrolase activator NlpD